MVDNEMTYTLDKPLMLDEHHEIQEVVFREMLTGDLRMFPAGNPTLDDLMKLAVNISDIPSDGVFDKMSRKDGMAIIAKVAGFLGDGDQEGES